MADKKVTINPNCDPVPPDRRADEVDTVIFDPKTDATLDFGSNENWPFTGSYAPIVLVNGTSQTFSMKEPDCGTEVAYEYSLTCGATARAGAGKIIIRR